MADTTYYDKVFEVTKLIPKGRVSTYGFIADYLALGSARMVGWALNQCSHQPEEIPAHRVVNRKGELSGRNQFSTPTFMQECLEAEGIVVKNDKIVGFEDVLWHPRELVEDAVVPRRKLT